MADDIDKQVTAHIREILRLVLDVVDAFMAFMAFMVLRKCCQIEGGLPLDVQLKMWINILLDFVVGLTPFVGDIIDGLTPKSLL
ncbi:hypothetical protein ACEPPN_016104 [Leptodophora sp. 'Broadleaf-Isolate-01']